MERKQKAWNLDLGKIEEGYLYSDFTVLAKGRNEAKYKMIKEVDCEGMTLSSTGDDLRYTNVPILRCKENDTFIFEEKELSKFRIEEILKERKRKKIMVEILEDESISHCYIMKRGSYYCKNYSGYTSHAFLAGIYTKQAAYDHSTRCSELTIVPVSPKDHNNSIDSEIKRLERILQEKKEYYLKGKI